MEYYCRAGAEKLIRILEIYKISCVQEFLRIAVFEYIAKLKIKKQNIWAS